MSASAKCPKCLKLVRVLPEQTARGCVQCGRWQYLYQAPFAGFFEATFKHLACVACGQGAWCGTCVTARVRTRARG